MLVSSVLLVSAIRDRLVVGGAKKLSSVLGRFVVVISGVIVYARVQDRKWFIDRMSFGEFTLEKYRILLTRCSFNTSVVNLLRGRRDQEIDDVKLLPRLQLDCKTSEMRDLVSCIIV
jgi:hypothetical protein